MWMALLLAGIASGAIAAESVPGTARADTLEQCVRPTPEMRRNHFVFIKHQRDITVHQGVRGSKDSLAGCVDCHVRYDADGHPVPINTPGEFCAACHEYTAVKIDCFTCHAAVPKGN
jgi:hypothetical protein